MKSLFTIIALFLVVSATAQWTTDTDVNTLVVDSEGGDMKAIGTFDGKTYVVFWKVVGPPENYELRIQVLDVDGNQTLGADGALVSNTIPMSTFTVIWSIVTDADDNIYIGVTGTGGGDPAYVFKLDSGGNHLWGANGVNVGSGFVPTILPLTDGGAIVSWYPGTQSVMQRYDASGTAVWGSTQPIVNAGNNTVPGDMFELSGGDYVMVFHSLIGGINSNLFAQRYNNLGVLQWGTPTQLSSQATAFNRSYGGLQDGDVVYFGYFSSTGVRFDSFLQRINQDGTLPWGINGSDFDTNQTNYEMDTRIAFDSGSQNIWAVCTYTNTSQSERGEYVQKFDKTTGARQLSETAKQVYAIGTENVHAGALQLKNGSPLFLLKSGFDNGATPTTLHAVYLDDNGEFFWPEEIRPVATFLANKSRIHYTQPVNNQSVAVFIEEKSVEPKIYAQNFLDEEIIAGIEFLDLKAIYFNNPVGNTLRIESDTPMQSVAIYSLLGQEMFSENYDEQFELSIEASTWPSGLYIAQIKTSAGKTSEVKVVKD